MIRVQRLGRAIAVLGGVAVAALTLFPNPAGVAAAAATPLLCLVCGDHGGVDVVLNLLLFVPLGLGIGLARGSWRRALGAAAAVSLLVELLQLTVVTGRDSSLSDLITNTAGGGLGGLIAVRAGLLAAPEPRVAWRLLSAAAAGWLALLGLSAWLQTPLVGGGAVASTWAHAAAPDAFQGRVLSVAANGAAMPSNAAVPDGEAVRQALRTGWLSLDARVVSGPFSVQRRWVYVMSQGGRPRLSLSQQRRAAVLTLPARSLRFRLNPPTLLLPGAFPREPGTPVVLRAGVRGRGFWLMSAHGGAVRRSGLALSPA
ncbi:MAG TPA: VanZ family protein, partial [Gemmatimonadales bacterium]|nr:VanZ family protein [Gemmatimonadales bacterium]